MLDSDVLKYRRYYDLLYWWFSCDDPMQLVASFFEDNKYKRIGIYGMDHIGDLFFKYLKMANINVVCGIDQNADNVDCDISIYYPSDEWPELDIIIVTPFFYFENIKATLMQKVSCDIISIEKVIYR